MDMLKSFEDNRQDKRRKIITGTIKIQRFWRIYKTTKYLKSISRIQRWWRRYRSIVLKNARNGDKKPKYHEWDNPKYKERFDRIKQHRIFQTMSRKIDSSLVQLWSHGRIELECIDNYIKEMETQFEQKWKNYEHELQKYLKNVKEYEDWICKHDELGKEWWFNMKTYITQYQHPGKQAFLDNRKHLFKLNVADLNERKQQIAVRRDGIYQREYEILGEKSAELKSLRIKMMF